MLENVFSNIDFSDPDIQKIGFLLVFGSLIFNLLFILLLRFFKLIIPKHKLHDDTYVKTSLKRAKSIIIFFRILFVISFTISILLLLLHVTTILDIFGKDMFVYTMPSFIITLLLLNIILDLKGSGKVLRSTRRIKIMISNKRALDKYRKSKRK